MKKAIVGRALRLPTQSQATDAVALQFLLL
jgi:hypothetical protein